MVQDFRKLAVWRRSHELTLFTYRNTVDFPDFERFCLTQQMRKAAISVESNIAEGSSRGSDSDFRRFLFMSLGSLAELETQALIAKDLGYLPPRGFQELLNLIVATRGAAWPLVKTLGASIDRATR